MHHLKDDPMSFTEERTREILKIACRSVGIEPADSKLLRHQTNAVYLIETAAVVVKIARPDFAIDDIRRTVDLTRWLVDQQFPTVSLCDVGQPIIIGDSAVTFWRYLPQRKPISAPDIAGPLRELHNLPKPPSAVVSALPPLDAISAVRYSLNREGLLSSGSMISCSTVVSRLNPGLWSFATNARHASSMAIRNTGIRFGMASKPFCVIGKAP